jgi:hypothetical protein
MDLGLDRTPTCTGPWKRPIQSADRSMATVGWRRPKFSRSDLVRSKSRMFCDRNNTTMMMQNSGTARRSVDANEQARERAKTTPLRNEAQLNCVALRSQFDCAVTYGAVKGRDERPLRGALDSPVSHHRTSMRTSENKLRRAATSALTFMTFS